MSDNSVDLTGIPEYFVNAFRIEAAGNGMIRIIRGIDRNGTFLPSHSNVMSAEVFYAAGRQARDLWVGLMPLEVAH